MSRELSLILFNTLVSAVLAGVIWAAWQEGDRPVPVRSNAAGEPVRMKSAATIQHDLETAHLEAFDETVNRPLFSKERRPPAPESVASSEIRPSEIDKLVLTGIVVGPDKQLAILVNGVSREEVRLQLGNAFQGWQLEQFAADEVVFTRAGETRKLPLYKVNQSASKTPPGIAGAREALRKFRTRQQRTRQSNN